jgi:AmmeMemoRadiSam system protein B
MRGEYDQINARLKRRGHQHVRPTSSCSDACCRKAVGAKEARLIDYSTSAEATAHTKAVVGYADLIIC